MVAAKAKSSHRAMPRGRLPGRGGEDDPCQQDVADGARHAGDLAEAGDAAQERDRADRGDRQQHRADAVVRAADQAIDPAMR